MLERSSWNVGIEGAEGPRIDIRPVRSMAERRIDWLDGLAEDASASRSDGAIVENPARDRGVASNWLPSPSAGRG